MAGDWIKMRADLQTHPKVVRIASALNADRLRAVGGLHAVWCLFDAHSIDGQLVGYNADALDDLIGCKGFALAMESVDWLIVGESFLALPRFDEHNGKSAKRRATETERKREHRAQSGREVSASDADKKRSREEKRREEISSPVGEERARTPRALTVEQLVAEGLEQQTAAEYLALRKRKGAALTPRAWDGVKREAAKAGWSIEQAVAKCLARGWTGFEAEWVARDKPAGAAPSKQADLEARNAAVAQRVLAQMEENPQ